VRSPRAAAVVGGCGSAGTVVPAGRPSEAAGPVRSPSIRGANGGDCMMGNIPPSMGYIPQPAEPRLRYDPSEREKA
jgi:hypothetical protein